MSRLCSKCGLTYRRRNLLEVWTPAVTSAGVKWFKKIIKVCTYCSGKAHAERLAQYAEHATLTVQERKYLPPQIIEQRFKKAS